MSNKITDEGKYYLYRHIRLDKNEVFYVGIGTKVFRNNKHSMYQRAYSLSKRNNIWKNIITKSKYTVEILLESDDYKFIKEKEKEFIALYGRKINHTGCLSNIMEGGEGGHKYLKSSEEIISRFCNIHGEKYDYTKFVYKGSQVKSTIICKIHGEFQQYPESHLKGNGCKLCSFKSTRRRDSKINNNKTKFIETIKKLYGEQFDYSFIDYAGIKTKVKLICKKHGEFWQYPKELKYGHSCQKCGREKLSNCKKKKIYVVDNNELRVFNSVQEFSKEYNLNTKNVSKIIKLGYIPNTSINISYTYPNPDLIQMLNNLKFNL